MHHSYVLPAYRQQKMLPSKVSLLLPPPMDEFITFQRSFVYFIEYQVHRWLAHHYRISLLGVLEVVTAGSGYR